MSCNVNFVGQVSLCYDHMIHCRYYGSIFDNIGSLNLNATNDTDRIDENSILVVSLEWLLCYTTVAIVTIVVSSLLVAKRIQNIDQPWVILAYGQ